MRNTSSTKLQNTLTMVNRHPRDVTTKNLRTHCRALGFGSTASLALTSIIVMAYTRHFAQSRTHGMKVTARLLPVSFDCTTYVSRTTRVNTSVTSPSRSFKNEGRFITTSFISIFRLCQSKYWPKKSGGMVTLTFTVSTK